MAVQSTSAPGPTSPTVVAYLNFTAIGSAGSSTSLAVTVVTLANADGGEIAATTKSGTVTIVQ